MLKSINPATGSLRATFDAHDETDVERAIGAAHAAQKKWASSSVDDRAMLMPKLAAALRAKKEHYARLITEEMGKPIVEARAEIEKCAATCDFYGREASGYLADIVTPSNATESKVVFDPLGVVLAVMPWNYPFWQFFRFAAPALCAGNGIILKHASNVPACALAIAEIMEEAGTPPGLAQVLLIGPDMVAGIIEDPRIAAVTLTGSTEVGATIAATAGRALKKQVLELGGSDPFIVLEDADVEEAARVAVKARFINVGQSCVNAKRFIVVDSIADAFVAQFLENVKALTMGNPLDETVSIGPLARPNLRETLHDQVVRSVSEGAELLIGGEIPDGEGAFYPPTVLDRVGPGMAAYEEETFGPVAAILRVSGTEEAIRVANDTEFGLGASLWTRNIDHAHQLVRAIEAGAVFINGMTASDARLPFGGIKRSGYGRELGSLGIREFTNIKTVWIGPAQQ